MLPVINNCYDRSFFDSHIQGATSSAQVIAPLVIDLIHPGSVVDIGCGWGAWLKAFAEAGVEHYLGIDGSYIDKSQLLIAPSRFITMDLSDPKSLDRSFDLAVCLEVAEHLPYEAASRFVRFLTKTAPCVMFSAALPGQGGANHINEQWPSFWRALFYEHDYLRLDPIRPIIWRVPKVQWWYKQNIYLYAKRAAISSNAQLAAELEHANTDPFELMHSRIAAQWENEGLRTLISRIPSAAYKSLMRLCHR